MAKGSVNKVILIGNLGRDPEIRYTPTGMAVASIALATTEMWKDKATGENQERTEWHRVSLFGRLAEIAGEYLKKGSKVFIEGRLRTTKWQDKTSGQDRYSTDIVADSLEMLGRKEGSSDNFAEMPNNFSEKSTTTAAAPQAMPSDQFDDDIPF